MVDLRSNKTRLPYISRLMNRLENAPGWSKLDRMLDNLYLRFYHENGSCNPRDLIARRLRRPPRAVLILCKGNICRSPFLAEYLKKKCEHDLISFRSFGLRGGDSNCPPRNAVESADAFGVDISTHRANLLRKEDVQSADLIIGMEPIHHLEFCLRFFKWRSKFLLLRELEESPDSMRIPDPYGRDIIAFYRYYRIMVRDARILLSALQQFKENRVNWSK